MPAKKGPQREETLTNLFSRLQKAVQKEGDYFSHLTALYLQGLIPQPPHLLTAVSPRRRRRREAFDRELTFVFHPKEKCRPTQEITWNGLQLTISTPEKTLIDLVQDTDYSPDIRELAGLFASLPYHLPTLLQLAHGFSDTVHKRVLFLTAWAGRASIHDLAFDSLTRTPVKLDPREEKDLIWDGRFFVKFPEFLLTTPVPIAPRHEDLPARTWMELRGFPPFVQAVRERGSFPIREEEAKKSTAWMEAFFRKWFLGLCPVELEEFLLFSVTGKPPAQARPLPALMTNWLTTDERAAGLRGKDIRKWVQGSLSSANLDRVETALSWGLRIGLAEEIVPILRSQGHFLFNGGRILTLQKITLGLLETGAPMPPHVFVLAARCLARESRFEECLKILDRGKEETLAGNSFHEDYGDLGCVTGQVLRQLHKYPEALAEFFVAREWYNEHRDHARLATAEAGIGNVFFCQGNANGARSHYLAALTAVKQARQPHAEASILGNLGMVEYDSGRLRRALMFLNRALAIHHMLKNNWNISVLSGSRAKALLTMGYFTKAMRGFQEVHRLKVELNHQAGVSEAAALLAWVCELMGRSAAARSWWSLLPDPATLSREPRVLFLITALKAMTALYHNRLTEAAGLYHDLLEKAKTKDASDVESGDSLHGIGVCETLLQSPRAPEYLQRAMTALEGNPGRIMLIQIRIFSRVFYPDSFGSIHLADQLQRYIDAQAFDPFWGLYAQKLLETRVPEALRFLGYHLRKTPPTMLQTMLQTHPGLYKVLQKIEKRNLRAAEFLSHIDEEGISPVHIDQYRHAHGSFPEKTFVFDGPIGMLHFGSRRGYLKPRSIPHGIMSNLLLAYPQPIETEALYRSVWGMEFDPECDLPAIKSALQRVRRLLKSLTPAVRLVRCLSPSDLGAVRIGFSCPWEAIV